MNPAMPLRMRRAVAAQAAIPMARRRTVPPPTAARRRAPLDQRILVYPIAWARTAFLWASRGLSVLVLPSWICFQAARGLNWCGGHYHLIRAFAIAHAAGPVGNCTQRQRYRVCKLCGYRYERGDKEYCRGDNGGRGCGCGHWRLSRLSHKLRLSGWSCPIGNFSYGRLGRWQRALLGSK